MALRVYAGIWLLGIAAVALTYLTGNFTPAVGVAFGFMSFGAIFMGMIGVLPIVVHQDNEHPKH